MSVRGFQRFASTLYRCVRQGQGVTHHSPIILSIAHANGCTPRPPCFMSFSVLARKWNDGHQPYCHSQRRSEPIQDYYTMQSRSSISCVRQWICLNGAPVIHKVLCSHKVKSARINRKAAGKSQATSIYEQRVMKHMSNRMQQKVTYVDSPPFIIGYYDRVYQDMCATALPTRMCQCSETMYLSTKCTNNNCVTF